MWPHLGDIVVVIVVVVLFFVVVSFCFLRLFFFFFFFFFVFFFFFFFFVCFFITVGCLSVRQSKAKECTMCSVLLYTDIRAAMNYTDRYLMTQK